jgi:hypothetical protein
MAFDVLIDFGYGLMVEGADEKQRAEIDRALADLDAPSADRMVEVEKLDGTTVMISEKRLAEIQSNVTNITSMRKAVTR